MSITITPTDTKVTFFPSLPQRETLSRQNESQVDDSEQFREISELESFCKTEDHAEIINQDKTEFTLMDINDHFKQKQVEDNSSLTEITNAEFCHMEELYNKFVQDSCVEYCTRSANTENTDKSDCEVMTDFVWVDIIEVEETYKEFIENMKCLEGLAKPRVKLIDKATATDFTYHDILTLENMGRQLEELHENALKSAGELCNQGCNTEVIEKHEVECNTDQVEKCEMESLTDFTMDEMNHERNNLEMLSQRVKEQDKQEQKYKEQINGLSNLLLNEKESRKSDQEKLHDYELLCQELEDRWTLEIQNKIAREIVERAIENALTAVANEGIEETFANNIHEIDDLKDVVPEKETLLKELQQLNNRCQIKEDEIVTLRVLLAEKEQILNELQTMLQNADVEKNEVALQAGELVGKIRLLQKQIKSEQERNEFYKNLTEKKTSQYQQLQEQHFNELKKLRELCDGKIAEHKIIHNYFQQELKQSHIKMTENQILLNQFSQDNVAQEIVSKAIINALLKVVNTRLTDAKERLISEQEIREFYEDMIEQYEKLHQESLKQKNTTQYEKSAQRIVTKAINDAVSVVANAAIADLHGQVRRHDEEKASANMAHQKYLDEEGLLLQEMVVQTLVLDAVVKALSQVGDELIHHYYQLLYRQGNSKTLKTETVESSRATENAEVMTDLSCEDIRELEDNSQQSQQLTESVPQVQMLQKQHKCNTEMMTDMSWLEILDIEEKYQEFRENIQEIQMKLAKVDVEKSEVEVMTEYTCDNMFEQERLYQNQIEDVMQQLTVEKKRGQDAKIKLEEYQVSIQKCLSRVCEEKSCMTDVVWILDTTAHDLVQTAKDDALCEAGREITYNLQQLIYNQEASHQSADQTTSTDLTDEDIMKLENTSHKDTVEIQKLMAFVCNKEQKLSNVENELSILKDEKKSWDELILLLSQQEQVYQERINNLNKKLMVEKEVRESCERKNREYKMDQKKIQADIAQVIVEEAISSAIATEASNALVEELMAKQELLESTEVKARKHDKILQELTSRLTVSEQENVAKDIVWPAITSALTQLANYAIADAQNRLIGEEERKISHVEDAVNTIEAGVLSDLPYQNVSKSENDDHQIAEKEQNLESQKLEQKCSIEMMTNISRLEILDVEEKCQEFRETIQEIEMKIAKADVDKSEVEVTTENTWENKFEQEEYQKQIEDLMQLISVEKRKLEDVTTKLQECQDFIQQYFSRIGEEKSCMTETVWMKSVEDLLENAVQKVQDDAIVELAGEVTHETFREDKEVMTEFHWKEVECLEKTYREWMEELQLMQNELQKKATHNKGKVCMTEAPSFTDVSVKTDPVLGKVFIQESLNAEGTAQLNDQVTMTDLKWDDVMFLETTYTQKLYELEVIAESLRENVHEETIGVETMTELSWEDIVSMETSCKEGLEKITLLEEGFHNDNKNFVDEATITDLNWEEVESQLDAYRDQVITLKEKLAEEKFQHPVDRIQNEEIDIVELSCMDELGWGFGMEAMDDDMEFDSDFQKTKKEAGTMTDIIWEDFVCEVSKIDDNIDCCCSTDLSWDCSVDIDIAVVEAKDERGSSTNLTWNDVSNVENIYWQEVQRLNELCDKQLVHRNGMTDNTKVRSECMTESTVHDFEQTNEKDMNTTMNDNDRKTEKDKAFIDKLEVKGSWCMLAKTAVHNKGLLSDARRFSLCSYSFNGKAI